MMAIVEFIEQELSVEVPVGTSILEASKRAGAPEGDACGGVCACSTCHIYVESGAEHLSEAEEEEEDILDKAFDVRLSSRLGCQARLVSEGKVSIRISRESQAAYYNEHPEAKPSK